MRHQHERDRLAVEDHVVLVEPGLELGLEPGAAVTELGELDEVLQLEVVDVVDQGARAPPTGALLSEEGVSAPMPGAGLEPARPEGGQWILSPSSSASSTTRARPVHIVGGGREEIAAPLRKAAEMGWLFYSLHDGRAVRALEPARQDRAAYGDARADDAAVRDRRGAGGRGGDRDRPAHGRVVGGDAVGRGAERRRAARSAC